MLAVWGGAEEKPPAGDGDGMAPEQLFVVGREEAGLSMADRAEQSRRVNLDGGEIGATPWLLLVAGLRSILTESHGGWRCTCSCGEWKKRGDGDAWDQP